MIYECDHYKMLNADQDSTPEEITKNYEDMIRDIHLRAEGVEGTKEEIGRIQPSYDILSDPQKRKDFDRRGPTIPTNLAELDTDILHMIGRDLERLDDYSAAFPFYEEAGRREPDDFSLMVTTGDVLKNLKRLKDAMTYYERAIRINPNRFPVHSHMGDLMYEMGRNAEALKCYQKAHEIAPDDTSFEENRAAILRGMGMHEEAENPYMDAADEMAHVMYESGLFDRSLKYSERALEQDGDNAELLNIKGWSLVELGKYDRAFEFYDGMLEKDQDNHEMLANKALLLSHLGRHDEALILCEKSLSISPGFYGALVAKAGLLEERGRYEMTDADRDPDDLWS